MYGIGGVGKTALIRRFIVNEFPGEHNPTIDESYSYRKQIGINGESVLLDVLDTAGREEFASMQDEWIREGKIFLLCFAITSRPSWQNVVNYRERLLRSKNDDDKDWSMVLVSTKGDLYSVRTVTREEILERMHKWNIPFIETSAKENKNVEFVYQQAVYSYWIASQAYCINIE